MKIAYYAHEYHCNYGARTHAREFYRALGKHPGVDATMVYPPSGPAASPLGNGRRIFRRLLPAGLRVQLRLLMPASGDFHDFCDRLRSFQPDGLVIRPSLRFGYLDRLRRLFPKMRICVEFNSSFIAEENSRMAFGGYWSREEARQFGHADSISAVSRYLSDQLVERNPLLRDKVFQNPNGVDAEMFKPADPDERRTARRALGIPADAIVFGYAGGMETFRRLPEVVDHFAALRASGFRQVFLLLVGTGTDALEVGRRAEHHRSALNGGFLHLSKWHPYEAMPGFLAAMDVGIFPFSNPYGSPQKIFEYLACALPVLAPDVPAIRDNMDTALLPFLVKQDAGNMEEQARNILAHLHSARADAQRGRDYVLQGLTWEHNVRRIIASLFPNPENACSARNALVPPA